MGSTLRSDMWLSVRSVRAGGDRAIGQVAMERANENIYVPKGFRFGGFHCGIKQNNKLDLALLIADQECLTLGVFTQNLVRASSVDWNESRVGTGKALVINSGNANACTGVQGEQDTEEMASVLANELSADVNTMFVMSTGIIGEHLPMEKLTRGIQNGANACERNAEHVQDFAQGILTTDKFPKVCSKEFEANAEKYSILGIAKGAGMIGPRMATMLCVLLTDFPLPSSVEHADANVRFKQIIDRTFNCISVDGHTSTSDQVLFFAPKCESGKTPTGDDLDTFFAHLENTCEELAKTIPADGEGATHLITIEVKGHYQEHELRSVAKTIADSPLVKTAVFGADPNWGRIVSAAGYNGLQFDPQATSLWVNENLLFENGTPVPFDASKVSQSIQDHFDTSIRLQISQDDPQATMNSAKYWTSDLTYDYVKINAEYHT